MQYSSENYTVPMKKESVSADDYSISEHNLKTKSNKLLNFSLKKLNKEDLIENIDRAIPIGIVILTLFIAFVV